MPSLLWIYIINCDIYLFKVPQHVELLLGYFALVQSGVESSAGVHQTAVAVILVRFDSTNVDLSIGAIITVLHQRRIIIYKQKISQFVHAVNLCTHLR